jgi:hypothetical protein
MDTMTLVDVASNEPTNSDVQKSEAIYVPFLGRVLEVSTQVDANRVARASAALRDAEFTELPDAKFQVLLTVVTADASDGTAAQIRHRVAEIRQQGF